MLTEAYYKFMAIINSPVFLRGFFDNRFYLILLVIILTRFKYTTYRSMWMSALINIPGTLLHETMHYLVGLVLNARPCNFTVFPTRGEDGNYVMGSVGFRNVTFYNAVPAAMAPLLFCCRLAFMSTAICFRCCRRHLSIMFYMFCCRQSLLKMRFRRALISALPECM